ncbi:MAG: hypothetical protein RJA70_4132 [Pseudomonadota bacterium]|jgi:CheY-like chemotaxis protein
MGAGLVRFGILTPDSESQPAGEPHKQSARDFRQNRYLQKRMRVLVIDDDDVAREMISQILRDAGHEVFELSSAMGATQAIFQHDVDAVVVDVMMPTMGGDKLAKMLRGSNKGERLWVVLVSSQNEAELRRLAVEAHADATVSKHAIHSQLRDAMNRGAWRSP